MRKTKFQTGEYYHVYNRGVDKREIFSERKDYARFIRSMREFNQVETIGSLYLRNQISKSLPEPSKAPGGLVEIVCYCLLFNHYHFILKQIAEDGISKYMQRLMMGYANYFNFKNNRSGSLFQGRYKAISIKTDSYLQYLSAYIHGNPEIHKIKKAEEWSWSSYQDYLNKRSGTLINKNIILKEFESVEDYKNFTDYVMEESGQRKDEIKNYFLE